MKKLLTILAALALVCAPADAQVGNIVKKLGDKTKKSVEKKVEKKVDQKIDQVVDKQIDKLFDQNQKKQQQVEEVAPQPDSSWICPNCMKAEIVGKFCPACGTKRPAAPTSSVQEGGTWTCPECKTEGNNGKFCSECGAKKPEPVKK
ncbi:MAG: hypothetical protein J5740_05315 [Bacteroidales bacterium]|nr:hypothetical protein [Bacteroidales bacterium]